MLSSAGGAAAYAAAYYMRSMMLRHAGYAAGKHFEPGHSIA